MKSCTDIKGIPLKNFVNGRWPKKVISFTFDAWSIPVEKLKFLTDPSSKTSISNLPKTVRQTARFALGTWEEECDEYIRQ